MTKVAFPLEESDWHDHSMESVWAEQVSGSHYRIRNVPYYTYGVSVEDVVSVKDLNGELVYEAIIKRGGHSTYRILLNENSTEEDFSRHWQPLEDIGCTYERASDHLFSVDVPPETDIYKAYALLEEGESSDVWSFEEGHCGHPLGN